MASGVNKSQDVHALQRHWFVKRIPLWAVVGSGLGMAVYYFTQTEHRASHPR